MPLLIIKPEPFFNRTNELNALDRAYRQRGRGGQFTLLYGRRRLGKTYLLQRYFTSGRNGDEAPKPHCYFLAEQTTAQTQRMAMALELLEALPSAGTTPEEIAVSWNALLRYVSQQEGVLVRA